MWFSHILNLCVQHNSTHLFGSAFVPFVQCCPLSFWGWLSWNWCTKIKHVYLKLCVQHTELTKLSLSSLTACSDGETTRKVGWDPAMVMTGHLCRCWSEAASSELPQSCLRKATFVSRTCNPADCKPHPFSLAHCSNWERTLNAAQSRPPSHPSLQGCCLAALHQKRSRFSWQQCDAAQQPETPQVVIWKAQGMGKQQDCMVMGCTNSKLG